MEEQLGEFRWYNEPRKWNLSEGALRLEVEGKTDFWRRTHYGFVRDNGHFWSRTLKGDFEANVKLTAEYIDLYDQAGFMIRLDAENWIKAGVEYVHGVQQASVVVTREFSDWSVKALNDNLPVIWLKLIRGHDYVEIKYSKDARNYEMLRLAYFPPATEVQIGLMAAAPEGKGFKAVFEEFRLIANGQKA